MRMRPYIRWFQRRARTGREIAPDEIFIDAHSHTAFSQGKMEGTIELPIARGAIVAIGIVSIVVAALFGTKLYTIQVVRGSEFAQISEQNRTDRSEIFAHRGIIYDRMGRELAWNIPIDAAQPPKNTAAQLPSGRAYATTTGVAHVLGYVTLPRADRSGRYYRVAADGVAGVEQSFQEALSGVNGSIIVEEDALGAVVSQTTVSPPVDGAAIRLSIDARMSEALMSAIAETAERAGFAGGAGVVLDVHTGEVYALSSYPEFSSGVMTSATNTDLIEAYQRDPRTPFINRALGGLYTPGSIIKPFVALAALSEKVITPERQILSTGVLLVPNPYAPDQPSRFIDWRAHGLVDMRQALAVSSNIYFYEVGGGFGSQRGVGIAKLEEYFRAFGIGQRTGIALSGEKQGIIPSPAWKLAVFGEPWRLGDTYNTAIGQYGFLTTPVSMARAVAAIANKGILVSPTLTAQGREGTQEPIAHVPESAYTVVQEGMRRAVTDGTAQALKIPQVSVAAKTGTAQVGARKEFVNSWVIGFFPYEEPRFAFAIILERAPAGPPSGAPYAARLFLERLAQSEPAYLLKTDP
jgi:penicillin-binding protein 2